MGVKIVKNYQKNAIFCIFYNIGGLTVLKNDKNV